MILAFTQIPEQDELKPQTDASVRAFCHVSTVLDSLTYLTLNSFAAGF